jgi:hypothetical protein
MASRPFGTIRIGRKRIELQSLTGIAKDPREGCFNVITADGEKTFVEFGVSPVRNGDTVTMFWGDVGKDYIYWLAVYDHTRNERRYVASTRNDLSGPWLYNWLIIAALAAGVFGVFNLIGGTGTALFWVIASAAIITWIVLRRRKLTRAVEAAITELRSELQENAASPAPRPTEVADGTPQQFYVVFGLAHTHSFEGVTLDKDAVLEVYAGSYEQACKWAFETFNNKFAKVRDGAHPPNLSLYPRGIVKTISL